MVITITYLQSDKWKSDNMCFNYAFWI